MDPDDDYYAILELSPNATEADVKKAYKRMALRWHPDKNQDNQAEADRRFKLISEAYEVLSDAGKRQIYDRYGKAGLADLGSESESDSSHRGHHHHHHHHHQPGHHHHEHYNFRDPRDVFREFFGPGDPFTRIFFNPDPFRTFEESMRTTSDRHRASNNINRGFRTDLFNDFMPSTFNSSGAFESANQAQISAPGAGRSQPLHSTRVTRTFTNTVNGRRVVVHKVTENGVETVTETVNGVITKQTVNGHPVTLTDDLPAQLKAK